MRRFVVIGLGHFGFNVAKTLFECGHEVTAVDIDKSLVQSIRDFSSQAVVADASEVGTLESIGIRDVDVAVVSLGGRLDASILATLHMQEMGVPNIVVKADSEDHAKVLKKLGATDIVFPEKDMAVRLAERLSTPTVLDQVEFIEGYSVLEIKAPKVLWNLSLKDGDVRDRYGLSVVMIRRAGAEGQVLVAPQASDLIKEGDILVLLGKDADVENFKLL